MNALISMLDKPKNGGGINIPGLMISLGMSGSPSDAPLIAHGQLMDLRRKFAGTVGASSALVRSHYQNLQALIDAAFDAR